MKPDKRRTAILTTDFETQIPQVLAAMRGAVELFQEFATATNRIPPEVQLTVIGATAPGKLADFVVCSKDYKTKRVFLGGKEI